MNLKPIGNRILIKTTEELKTGLIELPDCAKQRKLTSMVVAVGTGDKIPPELKPGMQVVVGKYAGVELYVNGEILHIVDLPDVHAIVELG